MKKIFALLSIVLVLASCSKDIDTNSGVESAKMGAMRFALAAQSDVTADNTVVIKIYKVDGEDESLIRRYDSVNDVPEYLSLLAGKYRAKVQVGERHAVSFDTKYYYGESDFEVKAGEVASVTVDCKLQSTIVAVKYDATVAEKLSEGYFTTVAIAESYDKAAIDTGDVLSLTYEESKDGYVMMPEGQTSLYWHFEGKHPLEEGDIVKEGLIENVKSAARYTITLKYSKDAPGNLEFEATVDESMVEYDDTIIFSPDPTILGDGFDMNEQQLSTTASRTFNVASLATINKMTMTVDGTEYDLLNNVPQGISVDKTDDLTYKVTIANTFFTQVAGGEQALSFHIEDVDGGKVTKEINYLVEGVMPLATSDYDLWFGNVTFKATVINSSASSVKVAYSADGATWTEVEAVVGADGTYTATGADFAAEKNYSYKLVLDSVDTGKVLTHQTAAGAQIPNGDMEQWHKSGNIIYPYAEGASPFWLTGNLDAPMIGAVTLTESKPDARPNSAGQYSAYLKSQFAGMGAIGKFAAGNLFIGTFQVDGTNGTVNFGRDFKFTAKPKSLSFWMKHNEGTINEGAGTPAEATGTDKATIMLIITNWDTPYAVNTKDQSTFFTMADLATMEGVIGYAYLEKRESATEWAEYTIDITYREDMKNVKPKKLVVSFTPSGFGDYFTGSTDSWMYVDDIVLNY